MFPSFSKIKQPPKPLCSRRHRRRKSAADNTSSSIRSYSSLRLRINLILIAAVLLVATSFHVAAVAGGGGCSERSEMMRRIIPPSSFSASASSAIFGLLGSRVRKAALRHSSLLLTTRRAKHNINVAGWTKDRSTASAFIAPPSKLVPPSVKFQNNFFSTAATRHEEKESSSTATTTALYATVPKANEKLNDVASPRATAGYNNSNEAPPKATYDYTTIHSPDTNFQIKSKPKKDGSGNWNQSSPLEWCQTFGSRSPSIQEHLSTIIQLKPGDDGFVSPEIYNEEEYPNVTIVRTKEQARIVLAALKESKLKEPERIHACDTEVMDIDLKNVGPVGNGYVTCLSVYSGPDFDYGLNDQGPGTMLWVDNLDDACGILDEFKEWLEDEMVLKIWHNYGFDRHVLWNEGINVLGFGGDTSKFRYCSSFRR